MTDVVDRAGSSAERSALELVQLHERIDEARRVLSRLLQQTVAARVAAANDSGSLGVQASEPLVHAVLRSQPEADAARHALGEAASLSGLDPITRLPLRGWMLEQLARSLALARRHDWALALLDVELDHFAQIQARVGREACDMLLRVVAERIRASIRDCDLAGRQDDGQFLVALVGITRPDDAAVVARKIYAALGLPIHVGEQGVQLGASIGISVFPHHGEQVEALLDLAAQAKTRARQGRPGVSQMGDDAGAATDAGWQAGRQPARAGLNGHARAAQTVDDIWLRDANERLVMAILDARELSDALLQAQRRHVDLLAVIAEELRDPQAPVRVAASLLGHTQVDQALLPRVQSMLDEQMRRMKQMLDRLDGVVATRLDPLTLARERVDLRAAVHAAMQQSQAALRARGQHVDLQLGGQPLEVMGDLDRLVQVLVNLLDNASKYSGEGGQVAVRGSLVGDSVEVEVRDNGIGLAAAAQSRIFAPFWHDAEALAVDGAGVGIGLTVVRRLVEAHGGAVRAFSAGRGLGSSFVVTLPGAPS